MTKATRKFSLADIDTISACNKPFKLEIISAKTREPTGMFVYIVGKDSDVYRAKKDALANEWLAREAANARRNKFEPESISKLEAKNIDAIVAAITGWEGFAFNVDDPDLEFTDENIRMVCRKYPPFKEQVQEAINDLENFMVR